MQSSFGGRCSVRHVVGGQVEEVVYPVPEGEAGRYMLQRDGCAGQVAFIVYDNVRAVVPTVLAVSLVSAYSMRTNLQLCRGCAIVRTPGGSCAALACCSGSSTSATVRLSRRLLRSLTTQHKMHRGCVATCR